MTRKWLGVALVEGGPVAVDGLSADEAIQSLRVLVELVLTVLHHAHHIVHALLQLCFHVGIVAGSIGQCQCRQVVTAHVSAQVEVRIAPVDEVGVFRQPLIIRTVAVFGRGQSCLSHVGRQQSVCVIFEQRLKVQLHSRFHRAVEQRHLFQVKMFGIEFALCQRGARCGQGQQGSYSQFAHFDNCLVNKIYFSATKIMKVLEMRHDPSRILD